MGTRNTKISITGRESSIALGELRWLVEEAVLLDDDTQVKITITRSHQMEPGSGGSSLSIEGESLTPRLDPDPRPDPEPIYRPHSRACGPRKHDHGTDCHRNCPSCGGNKIVLISTTH